MPRKIREIREDLAKAGFCRVRTTGSHQRWKHPLLPDFPISVAGKDGDDAKGYLEKLLRQALKALKERLDNEE